MPEIKISQNIIQKPRIVIFGTTGRLGKLVVQRLQAENYPVLAVGRSIRKCKSLGCPYEIVNFSKRKNPTGFVKKDDVVLNLAHARFTEKVAEFLPNKKQRFIVIGSTRYLTKFPDDYARQVIQAQDFLEKSNFQWTMLHPTMIYGAEGEDNVQRLMRLIQFSPILPLPMKGKSLVQPIYVHDVCGAIIKSIRTDATIGKAIHIGGPDQMSYAQFVKIIAETMNRKAIIFPIPLIFLKLLSPLSRKLSFLPTIQKDEIQRLSEDKIVDITEMKKILISKPTPLTTGLEETMMIFNKR